MYTNFRIKEIMHSGNSGTRWHRKLGKKYDMRRGRIISMPVIEIDESCILYYVDPFYEGEYLCTTPVVAFSEMENGILLETKNSIYELERV